MGIILILNTISSQFYFECDFVSFPYKTQIKRRNNMERILIEILLIMIIGSIMFVIGTIWGSRSRSEDPEEMLLNKENHEMYSLIKHKS